MTTPLPLPLLLHGGWPLLLMQPIFPQGRASSFLIAVSIVESEAMR